MIPVLILMVLGGTLGWLLRRRRRIVAPAERAVFFVILLLLFLMGAEVGGDADLVRALPEIGATAVLLTLAAVVGSVLAAVLLWRVTDRRRGREEGGR